MGRGELETHLSARDAGAWCFNDEREIGGFDGALEAVPLRAGNPTEIGFRGAAKIENDKTKVGIAREQVGGLQRGGRARTTHPEQMRAEIWWQ